MKGDSEKDEEGEEDEEEEEGKIGGHVSMRARPS
jgi:hypothetical protein